MTRTARLALYHQGLNDRQIAAIEGVHHTAVAHWRRYHKLPHNYVPAIPVAKDAERLALYRQGLSDVRIARMLDMCHTSIGLWRRNKGLPRNCEPLYYRKAADARPAHRRRNSPRSFAIASVGEVSLDAMRENGGRMIDSLPDLSWSGWLEEMGATAW